MKSLLLFFFIVCSCSMNAQKPATPKWSLDDIEFKTVQMEVKDAATKKQIFAGYKDSYIKISDLLDDPMLSSVSIKLSGYFQIENGTVDSYEYKQTSSGTTISYTIVEINKLCVMYISYGLGDDTPSFIVCVSTEDYTKKPLKQMSFTLKGFE
jgi:hypothetical protein